MSEQNSTTNPNDPDSTHATTAEVSAAARLAAIAARSAFATAPVGGAQVRPLTPAERRWLAERRTADPDAAVSGVEDPGVYPAQPVAREVVDALYAEVERAARAAFRSHSVTEARLPGDLESRAVAATLRTLDRHGWCLAPRDQADRENLTATGRRVVQHIWRWTAVQHEVRAKEMFEAGRGTACSREDLPEWKEAAGDPHSYWRDAASDGAADGGLVGYGMEQMLVADFGLTPAEAAAWVLSNVADCEWKDVSARLAARFGVVVSAPALRKWQERRFKPLQPALQAAAHDDWLPPLAERKDRIARENRFGTAANPKAPSRKKRVSPVTRGGAGRHSNSGGSENDV